MPSAVPFVFNAMELCVATINGKSWTCAKEVCRALEYNKKTPDIVKTFCSRENYAHNWQMNKFSTMGNFIYWPRDPRKDDYYINEEGVYRLLFLSQHPKAKDFRRHRCNVLFPHVRQQFTNKIKEDHQQAIEGKDASIALLNDDLQNREYKHVALQAQRDVYQAELQKCQDTIPHLKTHVPHARDLGKGNIIIIVRKHTLSANDKYHDLPYYVKLRWCDQHFPDHEVIVEIDNPISIHAFNRFEEEGHAE